MQINKALPFLLLLVSCGSVSKGDKIIHDGWAFQYNCTKELFASKLSRNKVVAGKWMTLDELVELTGNPQKGVKEIVAKKCP